MRKLIAGVALCLATLLVSLACAWADGSSMNEVSGIPIYQGPGYSSLDDQQRDTNNMPPEFHAFQHRPVDEVGYSPLTLADFRFPVPARTMKEFKWERMTYPKHAVQVWNNDCGPGTVTAFFFTRDMVRDHIQTIIDEYYICDPDIVQQLIDYYAEVTPQCGEAISWVWFRIDDKDNGGCLTSGEENRYFANYLSNFKDKFYLEFGLPKVQNSVDNKVHKFLYQYEKRGKYGCSPDLKQLKCSSCGGKGCNKCAEKSCDKCGNRSCDKCAHKSCNKCDKCSSGTCDKCGGGHTCSKCKSCQTCSGTMENKVQEAADAAMAQPGTTMPCSDCMSHPCQQCCPEKHCKIYDHQIDCRKLKYKGFSYDPNNHYVYYPRKVVIEDITYDQSAQAYRWKFAWRFNDCETDLLHEFCQYGINTQMALVLSDPTWYGYRPLSSNLKRDILASLDPSTWGNVWPAGNIPFDNTCCLCGLPNCPGNCQPDAAVGFEPPAPVQHMPEQPSEPETPYIPPPAEEPPTKVEGRG